MSYFKSREAISISGGLIADSGNVLLMARVALGVSESLAGGGILLSVLAAGDGACGLSGAAGCVCGAEGVRQALKKAISPAAVVNCNNFLALRIDRVRGDRACFRFRRKRGARLPCDLAIKLTLEAQIWLHDCCNHPNLVNRDDRGSQD